MVDVYIGWDPREEEAFQVAKYSILKHSPSTQVHAVVKADIAVFDRSDDFASSEFTLTRFLVPYLSGYKGHSIFMDCDVLVNTDIQSIMELIDPENAVSCVQHEDYTPNGAYKMDRKKQFSYPRKNWSSVMVFNNAKCKILSPDIVNSSTPAYLHRMVWATSIGNLHHTWNYLVGYYSDVAKPNIIHYTDGGPWFKDYENCDFSDEWRALQSQI
tara:strand:+ start:6875 stop:7516 length:642 start_codon:yes stop_codon:yes gene_type:complete